MINFHICWGKKLLKKHKPVAHSDVAAHKCFHASWHLAKESYPKQDFPVGKETPYLLKTTVVCFCNIQQVQTRKCTACNKAERERERESNLRGLLRPDIYRDLLKSFSE